MNKKILLLSRTDMTADGARTKKRIAMWCVHTPARDVCVCAHVRTRVRTCDERDKASFSR